MLEWKEINGIHNEMSYFGNKNIGVNLPELNEKVLFCLPSYHDNAKDIYFSGYFCERCEGIYLINQVTEGAERIRDGILWARFNEPKTENNVGYAIAYLDEKGENFKGNIPNIVQVRKSEIPEKIKELKEKGFSHITPFKFIFPCTFKYDWEYVRNNLHYQ